MCLLLTAVVSYLYGSVRVGQRELRISKAARIQLAILAGVYLLQGASLWLDRFRTLVEPSERITGPGYVGTNAVIPGQTILAIAAVIVALAFFVTAFIGRWRYPLIGTALLVVSAIVVGAAIPWAVTTFQVRPNELTLESQYYQRNLDGTKAAYGIDNIEKENFQAETQARRASCATTPTPPRSCASWTRHHRPDRPSARAVPRVLPVQHPARRRPLHDQRTDARHRGVAARAQHRSARRRGLVAEHDPRLHARLRHGRGRR